MLGLLVVAASLFVGRTSGTAWIGRLVYRSDFFCTTSLESFDIYQTGVCFLEEQEGVYEWRRAVVEGADRVALRRYDNASCTGLWTANGTLPGANASLSEVWAYTVGTCSLLSADENWYAAGALYPNGKPTLTNVVGFDYFVGGCGQSDGLVNYRQRGLSSCVQVSLATGPIWAKTSCEVGVIASRSCSVASCGSCTSAVTRTRMNDCIILVDTGSFNSSGYWSTCAISSVGGGSGLTGVLPPPDSMAALVSIAWAVVVAAVVVAV